MRWIDLKNVVTDKTADNFGAMLFRLLLKADSRNWAKLRKEYPLEAEMVKIFHGQECPYKDEARNYVDWEKIEELAQVKVKLSGFERIM